MSAKVHLATEDDVPSLSVIGIECLRAMYRGIVPGGILDENSPNRATVIVVDALTGKHLCFMNCEIEDGKDDTVHLEDVHVLPHAQGRGIGKFFMQHLCEWSRAKGLKRLTLHVLVENKRAIRFYEGHGWTCDGPLDGPTIRGQVVKGLSYSFALEQ
ncbi:acyl-CoA N-acyltransferase [Gongronella butleri]|nr:acyl-CoA N-acyltransferase [Gongronella butleri]